MIFKAVGRIVRCANYLYITAFNKALRSEIAVFDCLVCPVVNIFSSPGIQRSVYTEVSLQFDMCPMIQRIAYAILESLAEFQKLLLIACIARAIFFFCSCTSHGSPLIVVARKPKPRYVLRLFVFINLLWAEVTVIVANRHILSKIVEQMPCTVGVQKEIPVHKIIHILPQIIG